MINLLWENGVEVKAYDSQGMPNAYKYFGNRLVCCPSVFEAASGADAIIIATEWPEFVEIDYAKLLPKLNSPNIIDLRNIHDKKTLNNLGYKCYFVGQKIS